MNIDMKTKSILFLLLLSFGLSLGFAPRLSAQSDIAGSKDHPLLTRYPGAVIEWYEEKNFKQYKIAVGPEVGYRKIEDWVEVEGKLTRIYYSIKGTRTKEEVHKNYVNALKRGGFDIMAQGAYEKATAKGVGGGSWLLTAYAPNPYPPSQGIKLAQGSSTSAGHCYVAGKLQTETGIAYAVIAGHKYSDNEVVFLVDIIEADNLEDGLITVDAQAMGNSLDRTGKVALYGIYFDTDKSVVKSESAGTLTEIAKLMKERPQLKLYVVGHTDMTGGLSHNMTLSEARAKAVVAALVNKHGVAASRLEGKGVGPLAPAGTNTNEKGRSLNRRVELVAR